MKDDTRAPQNQQKSVVFDDDQVVGRPKAPANRRFFGLIGNGEDQDFSAGGNMIGKEDRALLQEALFDLLECKRLLDQVR
jgi:hypothetical protein